MGLPITQILGRTFNIIHIRPIILFYYKVTVYEQKLIHSLVEILGPLALIIPINYATQTLQIIKHLIRSK